MSALSTSALLFPGIALAQVAPKPGSTVSGIGVSAPELNPDARVKRPPTRRNAGVFAPEPPGPCPLENSTIEVTLSTVTFKGATAVNDETLRAAYVDYLGRPQKVSVICSIRDRVAQIVFNSGILARVEIPEQRIAGGALILEVIEAHVVNVRVRGDVGPAQSTIERYAEKLRGMKPFDMDRAQRYLLLASDVPGLRVRAAVRPSTSAERGAVDIDLTVIKDDPDVYANIQNTGSQQVGRWGGLIRGELAAQTSLGESTALTAFHTLDSNEQWLVQLASTARFGAEGVIGRGALVYGESRPGDFLKAFDLTSKSIIANLEGAYPLARSRNRNLNLAGGVDFVDQKTDIPGAVSTHDQLRVLYVRADGDYRTEFVQRPALLSGGIIARKGISVLGGSERGDVDLTRRAAEVRRTLSGSGEIGEN
jgi:hemolysin activation/secretion protein